MSKRKLGNLLKRKFSFCQKLSFRNFAGNKWAKKQLQELSRLGGKLVVMKMARAI
jgi:hypothetical protein